MTTWRQRRHRDLAARHTHDELYCRHCDQPAYRSRDAARAALRSTGKRRRGGQQLGTYRCPGNPDNWHIGPRRVDDQVLDDDEVRT